MRAAARVVALAAVLVALLVAAAPGASAHPLGNFSLNRLTTVRVDSDRVELRYVLDQAEIPTLQERDVPRARLLARKRAEVRRGLRLTVDGRPVRPRLAGRGSLELRPGTAGLETTRVELRLAARVKGPRRIVVRDGTFAGRIGWRAIVARPGEGTAVRTDAPSGDPTDGLRRYPADVIGSPPDRRRASFEVRPGDATLSAPAFEGGEPSTAGVRDGGFAKLFEEASAGEGVLALLLLAAFGWGALHALSPGHGKAMVAAYLVGTRGSARHAVALGATVTVTHTIGVFALGVVTLALSQFVLPEQLYPWLTLVSGLLVVGVGGAVLRSRVRQARAHAHGHPHPHEHEHGHTHAHAHLHGHSHPHEHGHPHPDEHPHEHPHAHAPAGPGWRGIVGMGAAAGLIPCPSALVVLLAAIAQHEVALGLLLIVAFSLGLAGTLTALGLAVVGARRLVPRVGIPPRVATGLPAASALVIVAVGCLLTARALPGVV
ncbi:MAG: nickel/cobalt transporter [Nocardioidaceae bacterium]